MGFYHRLRGRECGLYGVTSWTSHWTSSLKWLCFFHLRFPLLSNKPPIYRIQCPRGYRFDSGLLSFPDPLPTSSLLLTSCPKILHCPLQIKAKKPINNS